MSARPATLPPLFQWAGGKARMLGAYAPLMPHHHAHYIEPFAGGAALFSHLSMRMPPPTSTALGDTNAELMRLYSAIAQRTEDFVAEVAPYSEIWGQDTDTARRKALYYAWRTRYWTMPEGLAATALLYALMRTSFNGIWQTCKDSRGRFATPAGLTHKPGGFLSLSAVQSWAHALHHTHLHTGGYQDMPVPADSFVFCDPPYRQSFTTYATPFNDDHQRALVAWCQDIHARTRSTVWLANRDAGDGFFETMAPEASIHRFPIIYTAGRRKRTDDGYVAKPAVELLLVWQS